MIHRLCTVKGATLCTELVHRAVNGWKCNFVTSPSYAAINPRFQSPLSPRSASECPFEVYSSGCLLGECVSRSNWDGAGKSRREESSEGKIRFMEIRRLSWQKQSLDRIEPASERNDVNVLCSDSITWIDLSFSRNVLVLITSWRTISMNATAVAEICCRQWRMKASQRFVIDICAHRRIDATFRCLKILYYGRSMNRQTFKGLFDTDARHESSIKWS